MCYIVYNMANSTGIVDYEQGSPATIEIVKTKIGFLEIYYHDGYIYAAKFIDDDNYTETKIKDLKKDIKNYFTGKTTDLVTKYKLDGTPFQKKVWREIAKIPYGETKTYSDIAAAIGYPKSFRAVANACGQNKIALFIPCHRVTGINNNGGYKWGIDKKEWLLNLEQS